MMGESTRHDSTATWTLDAHTLDPDTYAEWKPDIHEWITTILHRAAHPDKTTRDGITITRRDTTTLHIHDTTLTDDQYTVTIHPDADADTDADDTTASTANDTTTGDTATPA